MFLVRSMSGSAIISAAYVESEWAALQWGRPHVDAGRKVVVEIDGRAYSFAELNQSRSSAGLPTA